MRNQLDEQTHVNYFKHSRYYPFKKYVESEFFSVWCLLSLLKALVTDKTIQPKKMLKSAMELDKSIGQ